MATKSFLNILAISTITEAEMVKLLRGAKSEESLNILPPVHVGSCNYIFVAVHIKKRFIVTLENISVFGIIKFTITFLRVS